MRATLVVAMLGSVTAVAAPREVAEMDIVAMPRKPPKPPAAPQPPAEVGALAKLRAGTWQCKGNLSNGDGSSQPMEGKLVAKLDMKDAWLSVAFTSPVLEVTIYRGYDAVAKQWNQIEVQSGSTYVVSTSPGEQSGAWTWTGATTSPAGTIQVKDHEQLDGKQLKLWGEELLGGSWQKSYEVTCTR